MASSENVTLSSFSMEATSVYSYVLKIRDCNCFFLIKKEKERKNRYQSPHLQSHKNPTKGPGWGSPGHVNPQSCCPGSLYCRAHKGFVFLDSIYGMSVRLASSRGQPLCAAGTPWLEFEKWKAALVDTCPLYSWCSNKL